MPSRRFLSAVLIAAALLSASCAATAAQPPDDVRKVLANGPVMFSADGGKTFTLESLDAKPGRTNVVAQVKFKVDDPAALGGMWVIPGRDLGGARLTINGKGPSGPLRGMRYRMFVMDPRKYLVKGENIFRIAGAYTNKGKAPAPVKFKTRFEIYPPRFVALESGPTLGAIGPDYFTVTCRTNMPAKVTVRAVVVKPAGIKAAMSATSERGYYHRLRVALPKITREFTYTVTSHIGDAKKTDGPFTVKPPDFSGKPFRFVAAGDSRSHPDRWAAVAKAIEKAQPSLLMFSGDMVSDGRWEYQWTHEFWRPARGLLSTVPFYAVIGNHEHYGPAYFEFFYTPTKDGKGKNWSQTVGSVLFIGVDGRENWRPGSKNMAWLAAVLEGSKAKFIFFTTHYPAWSSGPHGRRNEGSMVQMRKFVMPLLAKHKATAMIAGHDHNYERTEPAADKGVTCIVTGGAGAPIYGGRGGPLSKAFAAVLHYCVFDVKGDVCEMKVYRVPDGKVIDQKTFKARKVK